MHAIISLLPQQYYSIVENVWNELENKFGLKGVKITPFPHFSWYVADNYDFTKINNVIDKIAAASQPLKIKTAGIGLFPGDKPIIYIPVIKTKELMDFNKLIRERINNIADGVSDLYTTDNWLPHITLAYGDLDKNTTGKVIDYLVNKNFYWEFTTAEIAVLYEPTGSTGTLHYKTRLGK